MNNDEEFYQLLENKLGQIGEDSRQEESLLIASLEGEDWQHHMNLHL